MESNSSAQTHRWLLVSYYANVNGRAASHHIDDRLSAFRHAGIDITVLSSMLGPRYQNENHVRVVSAMPSAVLDEIKASVKRNRQHGLIMQLLRVLIQVLITIPVGLLSIVERLLMRRDKRWSWQFTARVRGWLWAKKHKPELVFSTGGPASAHEAARWIAKQLNLPLVCEFQDPLPFQYPPTDTRIHEYHLQLETQLASEANALIYLTQGAVESANERFKHLPSIRAKVFAILSGAPKNVAPSKSVEKKRVLAHIGTLSGTRNLEALLQALTLLSTEDEQLSERFSVQLAGTLDKNVVQSINGFALKEQIEALGRQPREALEAVVATADILLLIQNTGPIAKETIPSKAFEYLQTGRPILGLIDNNEQLKTILQEHGHAVFDLNDDIAVLRDILRLLLTQPLPQALPSTLTVESSVNEVIRHIESSL